MFGQFLSNLLAPEPQPLPEGDARLALAALLVRVARSDRSYSEVEMTRITRILATRYDLGPFEAAALRAQAETLEEQAPDTVRFTRAIKEAVPLEHRIGVIEALWAVVLADGKRDDDEDAMLRLIAPLLGINDRDSNLARLKVQSEQ
ncbi:MAG: TerB family tellurite resistance protein [Rhodobacteraceae bacterium]|nr:TerB family tellurite resistance protein [Paracoccaceae bacterium]